MKVHEYLEKLAHTSSLLRRVELTGQSAGSPAASDSPGPIC